MPGYPPGSYPMAYSQYGYPTQFPPDAARYNMNRVHTSGSGEASKAVESKGKAGVKGATDEGEQSHKQPEISSTSSDSTIARESNAATEADRTASSTDTSSPRDMGDSAEKSEEKTVVLPDDDVDNTISFLAEDHPPAVPSLDQSAAAEREQNEVVNATGASWEDSELVIDDNTIDFMGGDANVRDEISPNGSSQANHVDSSAAGSSSPSEHLSSEKLIDDKRDKDADEASKLTRKVSFDRRGAISDDKGGWRREKLAPVAKVQKYSKEEIVALYERGAQAPSEIKSNYPDAREKGPVIAVPKGASRQTSGGSRRALGGSRSSTPNLSPEDLAIFNPNKENVFKYEL